MTFDLSQTVPLSTAMREGSREDHEAAEGSAFFASLMAGRIDEAAYTTYLGRLWHVYAALEAGVRRHRHDPLVAAVHDPALERLAVLEADLGAWAGRIDASPTPPEPTPAVAAYVHRISQAGSWGGLLVAHHYTRYLGDLFGGQVIGRLLQRQVGLAGAGVEFYDFTGVPRPKPYRDAYRARLDALDLGDKEREAVVDEVRTAFRLNRALLAELEVLPRALPR
ncbi:heme oxygenase [Nocardioides terrae]|uniref:heme oxygenase (biliverdin-producing) n=1 Tax=Nocardioides terrae TaxID=574651 RepID=A0A1I1I022_9ACTN|nr:biliverdin-producing heme oxygenase [Nocardioides terrae]SFC29779.1 heme oxygenase [Nocardioides terrae]